MWCGQTFDQTAQVEAGLWNCLQIFLKIFFEDLVFYRLTHTCVNLQFLNSAVYHSCFNNWCCRLMIILVKPIFCRYLCLLFMSLKFQAQMIFFLYPLPHLTAIFYLLLFAAFMIIFNAFHSNHSWRLNKTKISFSTCTFQKDMEHFVYKHSEDYRRENISYLFHENWNQVTCCISHKCAFKYVHLCSTWLHSFLQS